MKRVYSLKENSAFQFVYRRGKSQANRELVLLFVRQGKLRIGFSVSKKLGGAVQRNRARRVMRAALAEHLSPNCGGYDIILVARARTPHLKSTQVSRTLAALLQRAGLPDRAREG